MAFTRSPACGGTITGWSRDETLSAIAEGARRLTHEQFERARWLVLLDSGTCVAMGDELAAAWPQHRVLIPLRLLGAA